jgi:riboflavin biosynthesis pyrimidine reductase
MSVDILTASSINGILAPTRDAGRPGLLDALSPPVAILERLRAVRRSFDAICVGPNIIAVDNPTLASHARPGHSCVRVTLDPEGKIPRDRHFFDGTVRSIVAVTERTPDDYLGFLAERAVETVLCGDKRADLATLLASLSGLGLARLLVEGGGRFNRALLDLGVVDRLHLVLLPLVMDSTAGNFFEGSAPVPDQLRLENVERIEDYLLLRYAVARPA